MANPQPTDAHIRIAHSISEAIMMRNFSKRQRAILDLILRLSWGCGKKNAIIPLKRDFRIIGVAETKIRDELEWLVNANVIEWSKETNKFGFLKDFEKWSVSIVTGYDRKRFDELLHINLTSQNGNLLPKTGSEKTSQNGKKLDEKGRNFPKNQEVEQHENSDDMQVFGQSKESIKTSKYIYTADFEKFYSLYPNSQSKQQSFKNWKTCLKEHSVEELLEASENYKNSVEGRDRQFIKTSSNFLGRDKFYIDYLPQNYKEVEQPKTRGW